MTYTKNRYNILNLAIFDFAASFPVPCTYWYQHLNVKIHWILQAYFHTYLSYRFESLKKPIFTRKFISKKIVQQKFLFRNICKLKFYSDHWGRSMTEISYFRWSNSKFNRSSRTYPWFSLKFFFPLSHSTP